MTDSHTQGSPDGEGATSDLRAVFTRGDGSNAADIAIVASDDALVAIDKPAALPSVPGRKPELADCAWSRVRVLVADALVVHRLDMATSGLLLFARGTAMQSALSRAFAQRRVRKTYVACVHGRVADSHGVIDLPLAADWPHRPRQIVDHERGKPSTTRWRMLERRLDDAMGATTLLELEPLTGRTHQLRVHLASLGHPIVGDTLYADPIGRGLADHHARMHLHALQIELEHPVSNQSLVLRTKEPPWMTAVAVFRQTLPALSTRPAAARSTS